MNRQADCQAFDDHLQQRLDERLPLAGDTLLEDHAARCAACEQSLQSHVVLIRCVEEREPPQPSFGFAGRVLEQWRSDSAASADLPTRSATNSSWLADHRVWATVAALAAIVVLGIALNTRTGNHPDLAVVPGQNGGTTRPYGRLPMASDYPQYRSAFESFATQLPGAMQQLESVDAPGWRPIRATFYAALETLLRTLPGNQPHNADPQQVTRHAAGVV